VRRIVFAVSLAAVLLCAPGADAAPEIHAHRGAHTLDGRHAFGEETLAALRAAWDPYGTVIGLDARVTADGVAVAFHDADLDRTTACSGPVASRTRAELVGCPVDVYGSPGSALGAEAAQCLAPIPALADLLAYARDSGATVALGIEGAAGPAMAAAVASGLPPARLIVESSALADLDAAKASMPGVRSSLQTVQATNAGGPAAAQGRYEYVSPQWPVDAAYVTDAHASALKVAPYTLATASEVAVAAGLGVDAVVTDDVAMARGALGLPVPAAPAGPGCPPRGPIVLAPPPSAEWLVPALASDAFTSPRLRLRWRGLGADDARASGFVADVRPVSARNPDDWRSLVAGAPAREATFTGAPGVTYSLRVSARDAAGSHGAYATSSVTVPIDERDRRIKRSGRWGRTRSAGAWQGTLARSGSRRARLSYRFRGSRIRVIARRSPGAGKLAVTLDGRRRVVATAGSTAQRQVVFDSGRLRSRTHRLVVAPAGGSVELDALAPGG
jgi:glycerophosphoryl diester phosphodiesterase